MTEALAEQQKQKPPLLRKRLDKTQLEEQAQVAALVTWAMESCLSDVPPMTEAVGEMRQLFIKGDHSLLLDVQGHLHEKNAGFCWKALDFLRTRYSEHVSMSDQ